MHYKQHTLSFSQQQNLQGEDIFSTRVEQWRHSAEDDDNEEEAHELKKNDEGFQYLELSTKIRITINKSRGEVQIDIQEVD